MSKKQAVLIIHGIGEQRPMDTLRRFVQSVWERDEHIHHDFATYGLFSKPDNISENFDLRRLTTTQNKNEVRTDFFEFYWAHLMEGNKMSHILTWAKRLILTSPWKIPKPLRGVWFLVVFMLIAILAINLWFFTQSGTSSFLKWVGPIFTLLIIPFVVSNLEDYVGDAARYLDDAPKNIKSRYEIRKQGINILKKLHESNKYDRIIVVGHSLGSVIAYDLLSYAWPLFNDKIPKTTSISSLDELDEMIRLDKFNIDDFQKQQRKTFEEQKKLRPKWLVSDLITLGSPLTYADYLLAKSTEEFNQKKAQREFPTCPPVLDNKLRKKTGDKEGKKSIAYNIPSSDFIKLHHAAVFGLTRWTNIYAPSSCLIFGDIISGPLSKLFGRGVKDISAKIKINRGRFAHTKYWTMDKDSQKNEHIAKLREALNLLDDTK